MTNTGDFGMSSKVTTKRNLIIFHDPDHWQQVLDRIAEDFGERYRMRHVLRRELGFSPRDHQGLEPNRKLGGALDVFQSASGYHYQAQVHLDFYSESAQSWFILKYL
jgi:hypothetical protein